MAKHSSTRHIFFVFHGDTSGLRKASNDWEKALDNFNHKARVAEMGMNRLAFSAMTLGPALIPGLALAASSLAGLAVSLTAATAAAGVFGVVGVNSFKRMLDGAEGLDKAQQKLLKAEQRLANADTWRERESALEAVAQAQEELNILMENFSEPQRKALEGYKRLSGAWQDFLDKNDPRTLGVITAGMDLLSRHIGALQPLFDAGAYAAERLLGKVAQFAAEGGFERVLQAWADKANAVFPVLLSIGENTLIGISNLVKRFVSPTEAGSFLTWLDDVARKFAEWSTTLNDPDNGLVRFMNWVNEHGPESLRILGEFVQAFAKLAEAAGPFVPISMAIAESLTAIINATPPEVLTVIIGLWLAYQTVIMALSTWVGIVRTAVLLASAAQWIWNAAVYAFPGFWVLGLIMVIVAGLAVLIWGLWNVANNWDATMKFMQLLWNRLWSTISAIVGFIINVVSTMASTIWGIFTGAISGAINAGIAAFQGFVRGVQGAISSAIAAVRGIPGAILNILGNLGGLLYDSGVALIMGLVRGIQAAAGRVTSAVRGVLSAARNLLPFSPAKEGPFSGKGWSKYSGQAMVEDLAAGISSRQSAVADATRSVMEAAAFTPGWKAGVGTPQVDVGGPAVTVILDGKPIRAIIREETREHDRQTRRTLAAGAQWAAPALAT